MVAGGKSTRERRDILLMFTSGMGLVSGETKGLASANAVSLLIRT